MEPQLDFQQSDGSAHPKSSVLKTAPLSLLILEKIEHYRSIFGTPDSITVNFFADNKSAVAYISPNCAARWQACKQLDLKSYMFDENPLSEKTRATVNAFFAQFN